MSLKTWVAESKANTYWKRSICYDGKPLLQCLAHLGLNDLGRSVEPHSQSLSQSLSQSQLPIQQLINPVLTFVKAFCLKGDNASLKSVIASRFDAATVSLAVKALWEFSGNDLSRLGLVYHSRRNTDKQQLFESVFADLINVFDTLDADHCLPDIYCEALDLLFLPPLELDPVSQLKTNTKALQSLCTSVDSLPPKVASEIITRSDRPTAEVA